MANSEEAMRIVSILEPSKHYFVDDSVLNVKGAQKVGWNSCLFDEERTAKVQPGEVDAVITSLQGELRLHPKRERLKLNHVPATAELREYWKQFLSS